MNFRKDFVFLFCIMLLSGCATVETKYSGFLDNYDGMHPSTVVEGLLVDKHPTKNIGQYESFYVEPVVAYLSEDANGNNVDPEKLKELTDYFYTLAVDALNEKYEVVDSPEEGALLIRTAITDVKANKPYLNLHWSTTLAGFGLGTASMEAEFIDISTKERVLAVVDARLGKRTHYTKGLTKWGHTKDIINQWVKLLIENLEMLNGQESVVRE